LSVVPFEILRVKLKVDGALDFGAKITFVGNPIGTLKKASFLCGLIIVVSWKL